MEILIEKHGTLLLRALIKYNTENIAVLESTVAMHIRIRHHQNQILKKHSKLYNYNSIKIKKIPIYRTTLSR